VESETMAAGTPVMIASMTRRSISEFALAASQYNIWAKKSAITD
jgi:hypothetical protein